MSASGPNGRGSPMASAVTAAASFPLLMHGEP